MKFGRTFKELCTPAKIYFAISAFVIIMALFQRVKFGILAIKTIFILIWTYILNLLCKSGYKSISWFLVLLPYIIIFGIMIAAYFKVKKNVKESMDPTIPESVKDAAAGTLAAKVTKDAVCDPTKDPNCKKTKK